MCLVFCLFALTGTMEVVAASKSPAMVAKWGRFEQAFKSTASYTNPLNDVTFTATFTSPLGETTKVYGFWDGGKIWRVRFMPDLAGTWKFKTSCSDRTNAALNNVSGEFLCTSAGLRTSLEMHGPVHLARDRRHLEHEDWTRFLWLGDTIWQAGELAKPEEWSYYAQARAREKFTVTQWVAAPGADLKKRAAYSGNKIIAIEPEYFKQLDLRVDALDRAGLLSAIVPFREKTSGSSALPEDQAILLLRYMIARWGANNVAWVLPCDGDSLGGNVDRWKRIGRAVFGEGPHAPVIVDSGETYWVLDEFRREPWVDLFGYQGGQAATEDALQWMVAGPTTQEWTKEPFRLFVNLATPFESERVAQSQHRLDQLEVRRAVYWTLLNAPAAGVNYGGHGVWNWISDAPAKPKVQGFEGWPTWQKCLFLPAAKQMASVATIFGNLDFWKLRPAPDLIINQPGFQSPGRFIAAARSEAKDVALIYVPQDRTLDLMPAAMPSPPNGIWINARTGDRTQVVGVMKANACQFTTPAAGDWILWVKTVKN